MTIGPSAEGGADKDSPRVKGEQVAEAEAAASEFKEAAVFTKLSVNNVKPSPRGALVLFFSPPTAGGQPHVHSARLVGLGIRHVARFFCGLNDLRLATSVDLCFPTSQARAWGGTELSVCVALPPPVHRVSELY